MSHLFYYEYLYFVIRPTASDKLMLQKSPTVSDLGQLNSYVSDKKTLEDFLRKQLNNEI